MTHAEMMPPSMTAQHKRQHLNDMYRPASPAAGVDGRKESPHDNVLLRETHTLARCTATLNVASPTDWPSTVSTPTSRAVTLNAA